MGKNCYDVVFSFIFSILEYQYENLFAYLHDLSLKIRNCGKSFGIQNTQNSP